MPASNKLYFTQKASEQQYCRRRKDRMHIAAHHHQSADDGARSAGCQYPDGWFQFTPDEKTLIYTLTTEGRKKDPQVYDVKEPEDRQPGCASVAISPNMILHRAFSSRLPSVTTTSI